MAPIFGEELRRLRQQRGISLAGFARLVNYDASYLSRVENGRRRPTTALAAACEVVLGAEGSLVPLVGHSGGRARAAVPVPVHTGWLCPTTDRQEWAVAICGSRATGTDTVLIDSCVPGIARLLTRLRCRVSHGPVGIGAEIMTFIADQYRPPGFDCVVGVVGRLNVIRPADFVMVIGGGAGTGEEVRLACSLGRTVIPLPTSGGAARYAFDPVGGTGSLLGLHDDDLALLGAVHSAEDYVRVVEQVLRREVVPS